MLTAWTEFRARYCTATARRLCVVQRTRTWEINWHIDQVIDALDRL